MKAIVYESYGSPDNLRLAELPKPTPNDDEILIKIYAVSLNGSDRENLVGRPLYARMSGLWKPSYPVLGSDIVGRVEAVGKNHTNFQVGDEVFGEIPGYHGGLAEYVCTNGSTMMRKPAGVTNEQAAAIPQAGSIAFRGICEKGQVQTGQTVLVNGAGGAGGSFAIQLAKLYGAEVTAVDNSHKLEFMRSVGADHVIDYRQGNFTKTGVQYDFILDLVAYKSALTIPRALKPNGIYFFVGGSVGVLFQMLLLGPLIKRATGKTVQLLAVPQNRQDLMSITKLCVAGKITPVIDRVFSLEDTPKAFWYIDSGQAKGKIVITLDNQI